MLDNSFKIFIKKSIPRNMNIIDITVAKIIKENDNKEISLKNAINYYKSINSQINTSIAHYLLLLSLQNIKTQNGFRIHYELLNLIPPNILEKSHPGIFSTYFSVIENTDRIILDSCFSIILKNMVSFPINLQERFCKIFVDDHRDIYLPNTFSLIAQLFREDMAEKFIVKMAIKEEVFFDYNLMYKILDKKIEEYLNDGNRNDKYYCKQSWLSKFKLYDNDKNNCMSLFNYKLERIDRNDIKNVNCDVVKSTETEEIVILIYKLMCNGKLKITDKLILFSLKIKHDEIFSYLYEQSCKNIFEHKNIFLNKKYAMDSRDYEYYLKNINPEKLDLETKDVIILTIEYLNDFDLSIRNTRFSSLIKWNDFLEINYTEIIDHIFSSNENLIPRTNLNALNALLLIKTNERIEKYINRILDDIYLREINLDTIGVHLSIIFTIIKTSFIQRKSLKNIFKGLLYLDSEDLRVRCAVYEIYAHVFDTYHKMDLYIQKEKHKIELEEIKKDREMSITNLDKHLDNIELKNDIYKRYENNKKEESKISEIDLYKNNKELVLTFETIEKYKRISEDEIQKFNTNNLKVFAAKIWSDLNDDKDINELYFSMRLLRKTIFYTESFYDKRLQQSNFLVNLFKIYSCSVFHVSEKEWYNEFILLIKTISMNFDLTKKNFELIFESMIGLYNESFCEIINVIEILYQKDKLFLFYLAFHSNKYKAKIQNEKELNAELKKLFAKNIGK